MPFRIGTAACSTLAAAHARPQCSFGRVATTTWWPRPASPSVRSRSWMAAPVK